MTVAIATVVSILLIAALAALARTWFRLSICPICLGVGGTWVLMLGARYFGVAFDTSMLPVLLGGSAVGVAYQLERYLPEERSALLWKSLFIPLALSAAYGIAQAQWMVLLTALAAILILGLIFLIPRQVRGSDSAAVEKLQEQMKKCC